MRKYDVTINETLYSVVVYKYSTSEAELGINGKTYSIKFDGPVKNLKEGIAPLATPPPSAPSPSSSALPTPSADVASGGSASDTDAVTAPIPGSILSILVKKGERVKAGQTVLKMEAMKMENDINSSVDGTVKSILVKEGDAVNQDQELIIVG